MLSFLRRNKSETEILLVVVNFTLLSRSGYRVGVPLQGQWEVLLNSDAAKYGGSDHGIGKSNHSEVKESDGFHQSVTLELPPLAVVIYRLVE